MKIKFINKNNNRFFEIDEGSVISKTKDETLGTGTIRISNLSEPIDVEPLDFVEFDDERFNDVFLCVDNRRKRKINVNPRMYTYEITLFSQTKKLEGIILPNLKITKMVNRVTGENTILDYLDFYLIEYGERIRVDDGNNSYTWEKRWHFSDKVRQRFADIICPEMQWNTPTLREVFNDLMMIDDCIVVLKGNEIDCLDLTEIKDDVSNDEHINYVDESLSSEDYISELQMKMVNVTNDKSDNINNIVTKSEWVSFTTDDAIMNSDNLYIQTQCPIYKLRSLKMMYYVHYNIGVNSSKTRWINADLLNIEGIKLVYETNEWQTKKIIYKIGPDEASFDDFTLEEFQEFQNMTLHYTRNSRRIEGFNSQVKQGFFGTLELIRAYQRKIAEKVVKEDWEEFWAPSFYPISPSNSDISNYYMIFFYIEYETLQGNVFRASKGNYPTNKRVVQDNQTNSFVDSYSQGILEYMKANRLGNEQKMINARYIDNYDMLELGDVYEDSIIYRIEYQIYNHHIEVNALATKDYVLRNYYTGVKAKLRSWKIVDGSEALTREDLIKYYAEFSYERHNESVINSAEKNIDMINYDIPSYLLTTFTSDRIAPLKYCLVRTFDDAANDYPEMINNKNTWYSMDMVSRLVGNSLCFTFNFVDNYWVEKYIDVAVEDIDSRTSHGVDEYCYIKSSGMIKGGIPTQYYRYTDDNGENYGGFLLFCSGLENDPGYRNIENGTILNEDGALVNPDRHRNFAATCFMKPRVLETSYKGTGYDYSKVSVGWQFAKDSQEITNISTQFEYCSDTTDISFTKAFIERTEAMRTVANNLNFKVYFSNEYNFRVPDILPDNLSEAYSCHFDISNSKIDVLVGDGHLNSSEAIIEITGLLTQYDTIYITDSNDVVLMILHNPRTKSVVYQSSLFYGSVSFYLNVLRDRNKNVYNSDKLTIKNTI